MSFELVPELSNYDSSQLDRLQDWLGSDNCYTIQVGDDDYPVDDDSNVHDGSFPFQPLDVEQLGGILEVSLDLNWPKRLTLH